ncbi:hypothetical protein [Nocardia sp. R7R-8]|uniref:hypothetical protein n=1 Tax=Nocardia sp. R7R-8 TaxID=3459304 RepID=UPI00403DFD1B
MSAPRPPVAYNAPERARYVVERLQTSDSVPPLGEQDWTRIRQRLEEAYTQISDLHLGDLPWARARVALGALMIAVLVIGF